MIRTPSRRSRAAAAVTAGVLSAAVVAGTAVGYAAADDRPPVGSPECDQLLAVEANVVAAAEGLRVAIDELELLGGTGTTEEIADAQARLDVAGSTLDEVTAAAEVRLCTTETPADPGQPIEPSEPAEPTTTVPEPTVTVPPRVEVDLDPTEDDGSVPDSTQITIVPEGSVATGSV